MVQLYSKTAIRLARDVPPPRHPGDQAAAAEKPAEAAAPAAEEKPAEAAE